MSYLNTSSTFYVDPEYDKVAYSNKHEEKNIQHWCKETQDTNKSMYHKRISMRPEQCYA